MHASPLISVLTAVGPSTAAAVLPRTVESSIKFPLARRADLTSAADPLNIRTFLPHLNYTMGKYRRGAALRSYPGLTELSDIARRQG